MEPLSSPLASLNRLYAGPLGIFGSYLSIFSEGVKDRVGETLDHREENGNDSVYVFPQTTHHPRKTHTSEEDRVFFCDFPHHKILDEAEYREYAGRKLEARIKDYTNEYARNTFLVKYIFPRYAKRFHRFVDSYLSLLTDPRIQSLHAWYQESKHGEIKREGTVITPFMFSDERRQQEAIFHAIEDMEGLWEKERVLLIHGLGNMLAACKRIERYFELIAYFATYKDHEQEQEQNNAHMISVIKENKEPIIRMIEVLHILEMTTYKTYSKERLEAEHDKIQGFLGKSKSRNKKTP